MKKVSLFLILAFLLTLNYSCKKKTDDCICIEIFEPVCGDDGKLYGNSCKAECAGVGYTNGFCEIQTQATVFDTGPIALDGCGWLLRFEVDGVVADHRVDDFPSTFEQDQLEVKITYKPTLETFTCGLAPASYDKIELINIEEL